MPTDLDLDAGDVPDGPTSLEAKRARPRRTLHLARRLGRVRRPRPLCPPQRRSRPSWWAPPPPQPPRRTTAAPHSNCLDKPRAAGRASSGRAARARQSLPRGAAGDGGGARHEALSGEGRRTRAEAHEWAHDERAAAAARRGAAAAAAAAARRGGGAGASARSDRGRRRLRNVRVLPGQAQVRRPRDPPEELRAQAEGARLPRRRRRRHRRRRRLVVGPPVAAAGAAPRRRAHLPRRRPPPRRRKLARQIQRGARRRLALCGGRRHAVGADAADARARAAGGRHLAPLGVCESDGAHAAPPRGDDRRQRREVDLAAAPAREHHERDALEQRRQGAGRRRRRRRRARAGGGSATTAAGAIAAAASETPGGTMGPPVEPPSKPSPPSEPDALKAALLSLASPSPIQGESTPFPLGAIPGVGPESVHNALAQARVLPSPLVMSSDVNNRRQSIGSMGPPPLLPPSAPHLSDNPRKRKLEGFLPPGSGGGGSALRAARTRGASVSGLFDQMEFDFDGQRTRSASSSTAASTASPAWAAAAGRRGRGRRGTRRRGGGRRRRGSRRCAAATTRAASSGTASASPPAASATTAASARTAPTTRRRPSGRRRATRRSPR